VRKEKLNYSPSGTGSDNTLNSKTGARHRYCEHHQKPLSLQSPSAMMHQCSQRTATKKEEEKQQCQMERYERWWQRNDQTIREENRAKKSKACTHTLRSKQLTATTRRCATGYSGF